MVTVLQNMWGLWLVLFACLTKNNHIQLKRWNFQPVLQFMLCWTRPSKAIFGLFFKRLWTYFLKLKSGKIKTPQWVHTEGVCNYCAWLKTTCVFNPWRFGVLGPTFLQHVRHFGGKFHPDFVHQDAPVGHQSWFANQGIWIDHGSPCLEIASWDYKGFFFHHVQTAIFFEPNSMNLYDLLWAQVIYSMRCVVPFRQPFTSPSDWELKTYFSTPSTCRSHSIFLNIWKLVGGGLNHLEKLWSSSMGRMTSHYVKQNMFETTNQL